MPSVGNGLEAQAQDGGPWPPRRRGRSRPPRRRSWPGRARRGRPTTPARRGDSDPWRPTPPRAARRTRRSTAQGGQARVPASRRSPSAMSAPHRADVLVAGHAPIIGCMDVLAAQAVACGLARLDRAPATASLTRSDRTSRRPWPWRADTSPTGRCPASSSASPMRRGVAGVHALARSAPRPAPTASSSWPPSPRPSWPRRSCSTWTRGAATSTHRWFATCPASTARAARTSPPGTC